MKKLLITAALFASTGAFAKVKSVDCGEINRYAEKHQSNEAMLINHPWKNQKIEVANIKVSDISKNMFGSSYSVTFTCNTYRTSATHISGDFPISNSIVKDGVGQLWDIRVNKLDISRMGWVYIRLK